MKSKIKPYFQLSMGMILAGSSVVTGKILIDTIPVFISQVISLGIALICIIPFAFTIEGNLFRLRIHRKDLFIIFLQALTGMFLFRVFLLQGLKYTTAIEGGIITSTTPAVLAIFSFIFLKESLSKRIIIGISLCVMGIVLINYGKVNISSYNIKHLSGNILIFLAVVCESIFSILRKKLSFSGKPISSTFYVILFAWLLFIPVSIVELQNFTIQSIPTNTYWYLFYYGFFCTILAYICWFSGIAKVKASVAAGYSGLMPVSSVVLAALFLGEVIRFQHIVGITLTLSGIMSISIHKNNSIQL